MALTNAIPVVVVSRQGETAVRGPCVILRKDSWNDYGFITLFDVTYRNSKGTDTALGSVKVLRAGQASGESIPSIGEFTLTTKFCSLGQSLSYYEAVAGLGARGKKVLKTLRDVAIDPRRLAKFFNEPGFRTSLLRSGSAETALTDAKLIFKVNFAQSSQKLSAIQYHYPAGEKSLALKFRFKSGEPVASAIAAVIGANGVGKTRMLSKLGSLATLSQAERERPENLSRFGVLTPTGVRFANVVLISHSALDQFEGQDAVVARAGGQGDSPEQSQRFAEEVVGYVYCGLRDGSDPEAGRILTVEQLSDDFARVVSQIRTVKTRRQLLVRMLSTMMREPSFGQLKPIELVEGSRSHIKSSFQKASSGHKVVLRSVAYLANCLSSESLVLIDEPETHLHPPLLASFLRALKLGLRSMGGRAVICTHSPVVLQELDSQCVSVMTRVGKVVSVGKLSIQTFGENVGTITRHVFDLSTDDRDFVDSLRDIGSDSLTAARFKPALGLTARMLIKAIS